MCYFCGNYCKPITVQYYIASCVSSVPRLTLMDLNWTYEHALGMKLVCVRVLTYCSYLTEFLQLYYLLTGTLGKLLNLSMPYSSAAKWV